MTEDYLTVPGAAITESERVWLKAMATVVTWRFRDPVIVNIGVLWGCSLHCLRAGAPHAQLIGVDLFQPDLVGDPGAEIIIGDSTRVWEWFGRPIHLLFVDGDHNYASVKADIAGWTPRVVSGGMVAFHDYAPRMEDVCVRPHIRGVRQAVDEWASETDGWTEIIGMDSIRAFRRGR